MRNLEQKYAEMIYSVTRLMSVAMPRATAQILDILYEAYASEKAEQEEAE